MKRDANSNLIRIDTSSLKNLASVSNRLGLGGLYQQFGRGMFEVAAAKESLFANARQLIAIADQAHGARRLDISERAGELLFNLPLADKYQYIASYYGALRLKREGWQDLAKKSLEEVAEKGPLSFRARALSSLGSIIENKCFDDSLPFRIEAFQIASKFTHDPLIMIESQRAIAINKSIQGDNLGALEDFRKLLPLVRLFGNYYPFLLPNLHNSAAVVLLELNRIDDARNASMVALASPYACAYPEWVETGIDIERRAIELAEIPVVYPIDDVYPILPENVFLLDVRKKDRESGDSFINTISGEDTSLLDFRPREQPMTKSTTSRVKINLKDLENLRRDEKQIKLAKYILDETTKDHMLDGLMRYIAEQEESRPEGNESEEKKDVEN